MWKKIKPYAISVLIAFAVGGLAALLTKNSMSMYEDISKPQLAPPGWIFPIVWSILYLLMGYASYRVLTADAPSADVKKALIFYGIQLFLNFLWPIVFFGFHWYWAAFVLLIALWVFIYLTMHLFGITDDTAENLLIPYLLWVTFAGYLNLGVALLN